MSVNEQSIFNYQDFIAQGLFTSEGAPHGETTAINIAEWLAHISDGFAIEILNQSFSLEELIAMHFGPYFPFKQSQQRFENNKFCRESASCVRKIVDFATEHDMLDHCSIDIVGTVAFGLANTFPYGASSLRQEYGYYLKQCPAGGSDIDLQVIAPEYCVNNVRTDFLKSYELLVNSGEVQAGLPISVSVFSFERMISSLRQNQRSPVLVSALVWEPNRRSVLEIPEYYDQLGEEAKTALQNQDARDFFWKNLVDRFLYNSWKLRIKCGLLEQIFLPFEDIESAFDPLARNIKKEIRPDYFSL